MRQPCHFGSYHLLCHWFLVRLGWIHSPGVERRQPHYHYRHDSLGRQSHVPDQFLHPHPHPPNRVQGKHHVRLAPHLFVIHVGVQAMYESQLDGWRLLHRELLVL